MEKQDTSNPLPQLVECATLIQIPFVISGGGHGVMLFWW
jgi:hypothetical protein